MAPHLLRAQRARVTKLGYRVNFFQRIQEETKQIAGSYQLVNTFCSRPVLMRCEMNSKDWMCCFDERQPSEIKEIMEMDGKSFTKCNSFMTHAEPTDIEDGKLKRIYTFERQPLNGITLADTHALYDPYSHQKIDYFTDGQSFGSTWCDEEGPWLAIGQMKYIPCGGIFGTADVDTLKKLPWSVLGNFPTSRKWALWYAYNYNYRVPILGQMASFPSSGVRHTIEHHLNKHVVDQRPPLHGVKMQPFHGPAGPVNLTCLMHVTYFNEIEFEENTSSTNAMDFHAESSLDPGIYGDGQQFWRHDGDPNQRNVAYYIGPNDDDLPDPNRRRKRRASVDSVRSQKEERRTCVLPKPTEPVDSINDIDFDVV